MVVGILIFFVIALVSLILVSGLLWCTLKNGLNSVYFVALISSSVCAVSAFLFALVSQNELEILKILLLTVVPGVIVGAIWLGVFYFIFRILIQSDLLGVSSQLKHNVKEVWLFCIFPSLVFLGYVVSKYSTLARQDNVSLWWLKGLFFVLGGLVLLVVGRLTSAKIVHSTEHKREMTFVTSPLLWLPIVLLVLVLSCMLWIQ